MKTMESAPLDGTRCLVLSRVGHYCSRAGACRPDGTQWVDAFYDGEGWQEWCGRSKTRSAAKPDPIGWAPLPSEQIEGLAEPPAAYLDDKGQLVAIGLEAFESVVWVHDSKRAIPHSWVPLIPVRKQP